MPKPPTNAEAAVHAAPCVLEASPVALSPLLTLPRDGDSGGGHEDDEGGQEESGAAEKSTQGSIASKRKSRLATHGSGLFNEAL